MKLNKELLEKIQKSDSKLLAVTKYWTQEQIVELFSDLEGFEDVIIGFGENRVSSLKEKDLEREQTHFIGNIQTKEIKEILKTCSVVHSVDNVKQLKKMEEICSKSNNWIQVFLQINVDKNKPGGFEVDQIPDLLELIGDMENVSLIGFSAIGKIDCTREEKEAEFDLLKELRSKYVANGYVSAGTSHDYEIALEKGVDILRIGQALVLED